MSEHKGFETGDIMWTDLTVKNAEEVMNFYQEVVGWQATPEAMDGYNDYHMSTRSGKRVCGICHAKNINKDLPSQWLIYITVEDMDKSLKHCKELGGKIVTGSRKIGESDFCVIQDPAGAVVALFMPKK